MTLVSLTRPFRVRASTISIARVHGQTQGGFRFYPDREVIQNPESWFVKVVSTLFVNSHSLDACLNYLCEKLTPLIAFEVIKRFNNPKVGFEFLEFSRLNLNVSHCYSTYNLLMRSLCEMGYHDLVNIVLDYMGSDGHLPDSTLLGFLVTWMARASKFDMVKKLLAKVQGKEVRINSFVYNNLLSVLVKQNQVHEAIYLFTEYLFWNMMKTRNVSPTVYTYAVLINALCKENRLNEARDFLGQIKNSRRMFEAINIFNRMLATGCAPDNITVNSLISCLLKAGMPNEAYRIRKMALEDRNLGLSSFEKAIPLRTNTDIPVAKLGKVGFGVSNIDEFSRLELTTHVLPHLHLKVTVVTPVFSPRVLDQPIWDAILYSIPNCKNSMVHILP
ncbi:hypothetical protein SADUNF_Sadunf06G0116500 [Salix dunnii]|uniref:Pentatricopeptide repeat-containing protein n=1 Tax=Salix dunnii TaxID=1413687 RepID=A0A835MVG3_9ROSI|nr:hypothetical protein SADUNF_Sadunf06G0116500 [Salix dunnii]